MLVKCPMVEWSWLLSPLLTMLRYWENVLCCFIGICFPVLHRRPTPGLILKMRILVSKQGRIPNFRGLVHFSMMIGYLWKKWRESIRIHRGPDGFMNGESTNGIKAPSKAGQAEDSLLPRCFLSVEESDSHEDNGSVQTRHTQTTFSSSHQKNYCREHSKMCHPDNSRFSRL